MEYDQALRLAAELAKLDYQANRCFPNAPYRVGQFKAKIHHNRDGSVSMELIVPERHVTTICLTDVVENITFHDYKYDEVPF